MQFAWTMIGCIPLTVPFYYIGHVLDGSAATAVFVTLVLLLAHLIVVSQIKRYHDRDKSGAWVLVPFVLQAIVTGLCYWQYGTLDSRVARLFLENGSMLVGLVLAWQWIELCFFGPVEVGDTGTNSYGTRVSLFSDESEEEMAPVRRYDDVSLDTTQRALPAPPQRRTIAREPAPRPSERTFGRRRLA
jgi:uncharacterized membrane protein YhaH (DUF805 family)